MIVVDVEANVPYGAAASGSGQELLCDVYHPPVDAPPFPALPDGLRVGVLVIHGGAWMMGEKEQLVMWARGLAKKGYVCVLNGYRLASSPKQRAQIAAAVEIGDAGAVGDEAWAAEEGKWPSMIHDCKACVRWMRANCSELGISPDHIAVTGNSAGGHLSLLVAGGRRLFVVPMSRNLHALLGTDLACCRWPLCQRMLGKVVDNDLLHQRGNLCFGEFLGRWADLVG